MIDEDTIVLHNPSPKDRIKQHLAFAVIISRQYSDALIYETETMVKGKSTLGTNEQARLDEIVEELQSLQMSIALINVIKEYLLFRSK